SERSKQNNNCSRILHKSRPRTPQTSLNSSMKMLKSISQNSGLDLDVNHFLQWLKGSKGPWNTSGTITMVSLSFLQATISWLKELHKVRCPVNPGPVARLPADAFATCSNSEMAGYPACISISIPTTRVRMRCDFAGVRIVSGDEETSHVLQ